MKLLTVY